jgi:hypothetical protein
MGRTTVIRPVYVKSVNVHVYAYADWREMCFLNNGAVKLQE